MRTKLDIARQFVESLAFAIGAANAAWDAKYQLLKAKADKLAEAASSLTFNFERNFQCDQCDNNQPLIDELKESLKEWEK
jgi:hypothetical protein